MTSVALGNSTVRVSRVILGAWSFGGWYWGGADDADSRAALHASVDAGITSIDTAPVYGLGRSEEVVGAAIQGIRDRVQIMTKVGLRWDTDEGAHFFDTVDPEGRSWRIMRNLRPDSVRWEVEQSLQRLGVDHIDVVQCHWPDPTTPIPDTMGALRELHEAGTIGAIGVSNFSPAQLEEAQRSLGSVPLASNQPRYSLIHREIEKAVLPHCRANNIGLVVYSPMGRGILTGRVTMDRVFPDGDGRRDDPLYHPANRAVVLEALEDVRTIAEAHGVTLANVAVAWVLHQEGITSALVGARTAVQAQENARAMSVQFSEAELDRLTAVFGAVRINKRPGASA